MKSRSSLKAMNRRFASKLCLLILLAWLPASGQNTQTTAHGPEVQSFLDFMRHEEDELEFLFKHKEISRQEYARSKNRILIHRQTVLNFARETGQDRVPELHVVTVREIDQLIEDAPSVIKGIKRDDVIKEKWRYLGSVNRGETFHIFERLTSK